MNAYTSSKTTETSLNLAPFFSLILKQENEKKFWKIVISISRMVIKNGPQRSKAKFSGNILRNISHDNFNSKSTYQCLQLVESMKQQKKREILSKTGPHHSWIYEINIEISTKASNVNPGYRMNESSIPYGKFWNRIGPGI